jgi:hypothetical protein
MCSLEHPHLARTCSSKEEEAAKLQKDKDEAEKQVNELTEKLKQSSATGVDGCGSRVEHGLGL